MSEEENETARLAEIECGNNTKCRMEGKEASAIEEDAEMKSALFTSFLMGYGDCQPEDGEWYATSVDAESCAVECYDQGTRWISINESGHCYCENIPDSVGGCEVNTGSHYYTHYKSFQGEMVAQGVECQSSGGEEFLGNMDLQECARAVIQNGGQYFIHSSELDDQCY